MWSGARKWFGLPVALAVFASAGCGGTATSTSPGSGSASSPASPSGSKPAAIKIGVVSNDTGAYSALGGAVKNGVELTVQQINAHGGAGGHSLDPIFLDGQTNPNQNVIDAKQLVSDHVAVVIGPEFSTAAHATASIFAQAHIPDLLTAADEKVLSSPPNPWIFMYTAVTRIQAAKELSYLKCKGGFSKIGILHDTEALGVAGDADVKALAKQYGVSVAADQSYDLKATNMVNQLTSLAASPAQAIVYWGVGTAPAIIVKEYHQLGIKKPFFLETANADKNFRKLVGTDANGMLAPAYPEAWVGAMPASDPLRPTILAFRQAYQAKFNLPVTEFAAMGHDAVEMIAKAVAGGATTPGAIRTAIGTMRYSGLTGKRHYTAQDHIGITPKALEMVRFENGAVKPTRCQ